MDKIEYLGNAKHNVGPAEISFAVNQDRVQFLIDGVHLSQVLVYARKNPRGAYNFCKKRAIKTYVNGKEPFQFTQAQQKDFENGCPKCGYPHYQDGIQCPCGYPNLDESRSFSSFIESTSQNDFWVIKLRSKNG